MVHLGLTDQDSHNHHDLQKSIYETLQLGIVKMNFEYKKAQEEKMNLKQKLEPHHSKHKGLNMFIHVAKNLEKIVHEA